jgi:hypothetical protein
MINIFNFIIKSILGPYIRSLHRSQSLSLKSSLSISECVDFVNKSLIYYWKVYEGSKYRPDIISVSPSNRNFEFPPYILVPLSSYKFVLLVELFDTIERSIISSTTSSTVVSVDQEGIAVSIAGGQYQSTPISVTGFSLDARTSFDLDFPNDPVSRSSFVYRWDCFQLEPVLGPCSDFTIPADPYTTLRTPAGEIYSTTTSVREMNKVLIYLNT